MPDREVKTIRDLIFFQYAKLVARATFGCKDGGEAKKASYGFIKKTFRDFRDNQKKWSDILREDMQFVQSDKKCIFCGAVENLTREHIVPKTLKINARCATCDHIQGVHNIIWSCRECNGKKGQKGLYTFFREIHGPDHTSDYLPALLEKKYLKTMYFCHECAGTLAYVPEDIYIYDIDKIIDDNL